MSLINQLFMRRYAILLIAILLPLHIYAKRYVYPEYSLSQIQQIINESDHIIFTKGVYNVDDNTYLIVQSNKKLTFESGSRVDFINTRAKQYESVFNIQGDNVVFEGLCFTSSSRCSRSVYGNGPRDGFSSLCTVIMIKGNNIVIKDCKFYNAEIAVSVSRGDHIELDNLYGECAQTVFATRCNNLKISNLNSIITTTDVGKLDHHIYIKGDCKNIDVVDSHFVGGPSYAIQISGDYSDPSISPKNVMIRSVELTETAMGLCVDLGYSDVSVYKMKATGVAELGNSFFLTNRGGNVEILNSDISNFNYIESETISIKGDKKGSTYFKKCDFQFLLPNTTAFMLYYLDRLLVEKCSFYYCSTPIHDGFIVRTDPKKDFVPYIELRDNKFYMDSINKSCFRVRTTSTTMNVLNNHFYNWTIQGGSLLSKDSIKKINFDANYAIYNFQDAKDNQCRFKKIRKAKINKASKKYNIKKS